MKRLFAVALLGVSAGAAAQANDPAARDFVRQVVEAINRGDAASRRALMHADALRCEQLVAESAWVPPRETIPASYRWRIEPAPAGSKGLFAERFDYAVQPTHHLHIDWGLGPQRSRSQLLQLVRERGQWREVTGCPKQSTLEEARRAAPLRAQQDERVARVAAQAAPGLKADVMKLVAEGRRVDAILHLRQATGEDLAVAKGVVERWTEPAR